MPPAVTDREAALERCVQRQREQTSAPPVREVTLIKTLNVRRSPGWAYFVEPDLCVWRVPEAAESDTEMDATKQLVVASGVPPDPRFRNRVEDTVRYYLDAEGNLSAAPVLRGR